MSARDGLPPTSIGAGTGKAYAFAHTRQKQPAWGLVYDGARSQAPAKPAEMRV